MAPKQATNREGLTLLEWVLAAGVPLTRRSFAGGYFARDPYREGLRLRDVGKRVRAAWEAGEDPTEWRVCPH